MICGSWNNAWISSGHLRSGQWTVHVWQVRAADRPPFFSPNLVNASRAERICQPQTRYLVDKTHFCVIVVVRACFVGRTDTFVHQIPTGLKLRRVDEMASIAHLASHPLKSTGFYRTCGLSFFVERVGLCTDVVFCCCFFGMVPPGSGSEPTAPSAEVLRWRRMGGAPCTSPRKRASYRRASVGNEKWDEPLWDSLKDSHRGMVFLGAHSTSHSLSKHME